MDSPNNIQSVLVHVGLDRLGDGLLKLPFVKGLRTAFPNAQLTWFAGKETTVYARSLKALVSEDLDEVIEYGGIGHTPKELFSARPLSDRKFDLIIDTQRNFWVALSTMRIRHRYFISPAAKFMLSSVRPKRGYKFPKAMQRQMLDLLEICTPISFPTPDTLELKIPDAHKVSAQSLLPDGPCYIGLAPGSGGRPKCWPLDSYINVAKKIEADGGVPVFFIGPQEQEWADVISKQFPLTSLPLQQGEGPEHHHFDPLFTIALAQRLAASVSNDSGVAHMFAVSGVPLVALYGPTVYEKFPPMAKNIQVIRAENYGSRDMSSIPENAVIAALDQLLKSHGA